MKEATCRHAQLPRWFPWANSHPHAMAWRVFLVRLLCTCHVRVPQSYKFVRSWVFLHTCVLVSVASCAVHNGQLC